MTAAAFWKNGSIAECVLYELPLAYDDTLPSGIKTTCIVSCNKDDSMKA